MTGRASARYTQLQSTRTPYLDRARQCAKLTLPYLFPPEGSTGSNTLPTPYQGVGARGTNNLAAKLLLVTLPPNTPSFRQIVDPFTLKAMSADPKLKTEIEKALGEYERALQGDIESSGDRVPVFETMKNLLVGGNVLLHMHKEGMRVFNLTRYVAKRDPMGNVLEIVIKEDLDPIVLASMGIALTSPVSAGQKATEVKSVALYTHVTRKKDMFHVYQEVEDHVVPGSQGTFPLDKTPFLALRFTRIDGEDYGRGFIEEYLGDLVSLEGLTESIVEGSAAAARVLFLINPNGTTQAKTIDEAPNGAIRQGNAEDVTVLQLDKYADFRVALETMDRIEARMAKAFLLTSSVQRNAERVTAEEIRLLASELEEALGGVYSILSQEFQLPYIRRRAAQMQKEGRLPKLPKDVVRTAIITGLEALGRGHDLRKLDSFIQGVAEAVGPEAVAKYVNVGNYISRRATAVGIDTEGLIRTDEEVAQREQATQQQAMLSQFGPEVLKQAGNAAVAASSQGAPA